ncbi:MAG: PQQ-dependent sugar dehydrogenase [Flavobacteriales bacterium]|nr:PQQ-dependent sugar dehydrogenase [Flavobacteriales bacterium]MBK6945094.1 PQQ-dependent sugar dehydrogenase [Flavobacteriales bacterium]MBK7239443.1 PQQ-dependent sugar dehydrogenase [Flavobacteriales bacterium]MBK7295985.1 PQQ-dependent sugar dehydrogenase [Flavobacteriales bacterium]MBK9535349.1 PQQ-dependent sugar dehydrogenase [Flavobacteriales bacterium]
MKKLLLLVFLPATFAYSQTPVSINLQSFATGLPSVVDLAHAGDERLFAVLQPGTIRIINADGTVVPTPFLDITSRVNSGGEQGLLGLAFDPNYVQNGFFYVNYIFGSGNGNTRISRFQVSSDPNVALDTTEQVIYTWPQPYSNHNGGDLDFGPDGYLYVGFGDGGSAGDPEGRAQDVSNPLGDMIRIDVSDPDTIYTIPPTNPFANVTANSDTLPEIWASGLRNPFRWGFDALSGDLWIGDVGQNAYEEVDFWPAGNNSHPNFGWRCYEGLHPYNTTGCLPIANYVAPVSEHAQSTFGWYSVIGGRVYRGQEFPRLEGRYIYTDYVGGDFFSLLPDGIGGWVREEIRNSTTTGYTCIAENNDGELFVTNITSGIVYRIVDACPQDAPTVDQNTNTLTSSQATAYQWYLNGQAITGATDQTLDVVESGTYYVVATVGPNCQLASDTVEVIFNGIGGTVHTSLEIYPNPAKERIVVNGLPAMVTLIKLFDVSGRELLNSSARSVNGSTTVNVSDISTGRYSLVFLSADGTVIEQRSVTVQH